eukprot:CAMPEP_0117067388 /NCGR_PEP_ID=MMETSP0472-20121206/47156_1 /TAXON_ID=693140 ORGANISM="Tiarina fusus, Strain LIS" /NCGR_SAMPLE_ID=MMETSP0472 /ASSEMBLY_ACC=CAM_ASM_000603 /LENGTH=100 /DNA_ID=CAMNT_0004788883 /DNA_START=36 /DNA_END=335 /DNA_ORIENTATION=-
MPPYKKSCGSVSSYVSVEHNEAGYDSFEVRLLGGVHAIEIPTMSSLKIGKTLTGSGDASYDNLLAFELIEYEKWGQLIKIVKRNPGLAEFRYPNENSPAF